MLLGGTINPTHVFSKGKLIICYGGDTQTILFNLSMILGNSITI